MFVEQISVALAANLPIIIHTREAEEDTLALMMQHIPSDWPLHVHCFTDSLRFCQELVGKFRNLYVGFTGAITFKNATALRDVVSWLPLDRLLLETGSLLSY